MSQEVKIKKVATAQGADVKTKKSKKAKKALDAKNLDVAKKKITKEKDLMYVYPKGTETLESRKKFRTDARRKLASFQKSIAKADKADKADLIKAATEWAKGIYTSEHMPKI